MSYKVAVYVPNQVKPSYNAIRFATEDEADRYGYNLWMRWTGCDRVAAEVSDDPVNYTYTSVGKLEEVAV